MRMLRAGLGFLFLAATVAASTSCNTPTLPIPPPIVVALEGPDPITGLVEVRVLAEHVEPDAEYLMAFNQRTSEFRGGPVEPATGDFVVRIPALRGDCLIAYWMYQIYEVGMGTSCLMVP